MKFLFSLTLRLFVFILHIHHIAIIYTRTHDIIIIQYDNPANITRNTEGVHHPKGYDLSQSFA